MRRSIAEYERDTTCEPSLPCKSYLGFQRQENCRLGGPDRELGGAWSGPPFCRLTREKNLLMYYVGIDPGAIYTGLAVLHEDSSVFHREYVDPVALYRDLWHQLLKLNKSCHIALEAMIGGGPRNDSITRTIK